MGLHWSKLMTYWNKILTQIMYTVSISHLGYFQPLQLSNVDKWEPVYEAMSSSSLQCEKGRILREEWQCFNCYISLHVLCLWEGISSSPSGLL